MSIYSDDITGYCSYIVGAVVSKTIVRFNFLIIQFFNLNAIWLPSLMTLSMITTYLNSHRFDDGGRPAYLDQYLPNSNKQTLKGKRAVLESTAYGKRPNQK